MPFETRELQKFTDAGRAIADAAQSSFEQWAEGESGVVLKEWAEEVKVRDLSEARLKSRSKAAEVTGVRRGGPTGITVNTGRRGGFPGRGWFRGGRKGKRSYTVTGRVSDEGTIGYAPRHFKDADWANISEAMADYASELARLVPLGQKAVALARQSVVQIADALGIALETVKGGGSLSGDAISKARDAVSQDGNRYVNGTGVRTKTDTEFSIEMINRYPGIQESGIDTALFRVVQSRLGYHVANLYSVLKKDTGALAKSYPYLQVT